MSGRRLQSVVLFLLALAFAALPPRDARALLRYGPLQISGNVQSQNLIRTPDQDTFEYIQNRNTAHVRLDYDWLQAGKLINKYEIPFIESSHLFLLWRGVYDSVYDTTPGFIQKEDIHGRAYGSNPQNPDQALTVFGRAIAGGYGRSVLTLNGLTSGQKDALKFDNQLREFYADIKFRGIPLTVRAGRQQVVWGETDNFRMLDRVNTLNLTWHFTQELPPPAFGWDEIRRPFWMLKFLYDLGNIGPISQSFLEWYWNPGDWYPAKQQFLPLPWGLPILNPLTNPIDGAFIGGICTSRPKKIKSGPNAGLGFCETLMNNTKLFEKGDWNRNPFDNSQFGIRYHGIAPFGLEFTLNYFYQRFGGDDGTNFAQLQGLPNTPQNKALASHLINDKGIFPAEYIAPYVHTVGASANYSDERFTQAVFRFETIYDFGIPFYDIAKETVVQPSPVLPGITKKNMWKGMLAFDRNTWIKSLNKKSTIFLTGQFFWHYLVNNPHCRPEDVALNPELKAHTSSCLIGGLDLPSTVRNGTTPQTPAYRDKIRSWETLFTLAAFTFYRGGSIVPVIGTAVDPVNQYSMEAFWDVDYVLRDDLILNLGQRYFITPRGHSTPIFETWGLGGLLNGRSETSVRVTYQF